MGRGRPKGSSRGVAISKGTSAVPDGNKGIGRGGGRGGGRGRGRGRGERQYLGFGVRFDKHGDTIVNVGRTNILFMKILHLKNSQFHCLNCFYILKMTVQVEETINIDKIPNRQFVSPQTSQLSSLSHNGNLTAYSNQQFYYDDTSLPISSQASHSPEINGLQASPYL